MRKKKNKARRNMLSIVWLFAAMLVYAFSSGADGMEKQDTMSYVSSVPEDGGVDGESMPEMSESHFIPEDIAGVNNVRERTAQVAGEVKGYESSGEVFINNEAKAAIDVESMLKDPFRIRAKGDGPQVLIVHTHGTEAYQGSPQSAGTDRSLDKNYNIIRVGKEMKAAFEAEGIETVHITDLFDYPSYNGSYGRSLVAIEKALRENPGIQVVIDVHRDSVIGKDGTKYKMVASVGEQRVAQLMFVMGSNVSGLPHDGWKNNLNFAAQLQQRMNGRYGNIMRPMLLRAPRYNQQASPGSILLEVGSSGNTLEEAIASATLFSEELAAYLKGE